MIGKVDEEINELVASEEFQGKPEAEKRKLIGLRFLCMTLGDSVYDSACAIDNAVLH